MPRCNYVHRRDPSRAGNSHPCGARMSFDSLDSDNPHEVTCPRCRKQIERASPPPRSSGTTASEARHEWAPAIDSTFDALICLRCGAVSCEPIGESSSECRAPVAGAVSGQGGET